ncbi:uncharacterized protein LOC111830956 [Capsella rubella]|uniref:uncharacterized protein LOC111830956 n=1 Tax=Capsella rubella TaxID=81985 RepID=UPI000CD4E5F3|nr:uncharacterized protein LOC111830956 [Capsella rubella]
MSLKPSRLGAKDKKIWVGNALGTYSTKSGYYVARENLAISNPLLPQRDVDWKKEVWAVHTSPKLKMFLWKTLHGALPTGQQLVHRHIPANLRCSFCGEDESITHLMFACPFAVSVWELVPFSAPFISSQVVEVRVGLAAASKLTCLPPVGLTSGPLAPWICWNLWKSRNQRVFNDRNFSAEETVLKSILDAKEWFSAHCKSDGAWRKDLQTAGLGWTFTNSNGDTSLHSAICEHVSSPLMAESLACRAALMDAKWCYLVW